MKRLILFATLGMFSFLCVIIGSTHSGVAQAVPDRVQQVYNSTEAKTSVPLIVPSIIPLTSQAAPIEYWAFSIAPASDAYSISFDRAADCTEVEECSFAIASGKVRSSRDPTLESLLERASITKAEAVSLANGVDAVYVPAREDIYMPSFIYWDIDEYRYSVGIYMGRKNEVLEMADSSIRAD